MSIIILFANKMSSNQFFVILPSQTYGYKTNKPNKFRTHLPRTLNLQGNWVVGLHSISYSYSWNNLGTLDSQWLQFHLINGQLIRVPIPNSSYSSQENVEKTLINNIKQELEKYLEKRNKRIKRNAPVEPELAPDSVDPDAASPPISPPATPNVPSKQQPSPQTPTKPPASPKLPSRPPPHKPPLSPIQPNKPPPTRPTHATQPPKTPPSTKQPPKSPQSPKHQPIAPPKPSLSPKQPTAPPPKKPLTKQPPTPKLPIPPPQQATLTVPSTQTLPMIDVDPPENKKAKLDKQDVVDGAYKLALLDPRVDQPKNPKPINPLEKLLTNIRKEPIKKGEEFGGENFFFPSTFKDNDIRNYVNAVKIKFY